MPTAVLVHTTVSLRKDRPLTSVPVCGLAFFKYSEQLQKQKLIHIHALISNSHYKMNKLTNVNIMFVTYNLSKF